MKVLVVGPGGREHALAWKLARSPRVRTVFVAPGNGGTATEPGVRNVPLTDLDALADFAHRGWIKLESRSVTIYHPERLQRRAR